MTVLSREELRAALAGPPALVEDVDIQSQLQPNGVDLRVERVQRLTSPGLLGSADIVREPAAREDVQTDKDGWWDLHRGAYVITYREKVNLPTDLMALSRPRSSLLRSGVSIHGAVWDAGYSGRGEGLLTVLAPPSGADVERDLVYRTDGDGALRLDVYRPPSGRRACPVVFLVNGDAPEEIIAAAKDWGVFRSYGEHLAARGLVGVPFNHRSTNRFE